MFKRVCMKMLSKMLSCTVLAFSEYCTFCSLVLWINEIGLDTGKKMHVEGCCRRNCEWQKKENEEDTRWWIVLR